MEKIEIKHEESIENQSQEFQDWFNENVIPRIDFGDSCTERDEFGRPSIWKVEGMYIQAVYFTQNANYNFNHFIIK